MFDHYTVFCFHTYNLFVSFFPKLQGRRSIHHSRCIFSSIPAQTAVYRELSRAASEIFMIITKISVKDFYDFRKNFSRKWVDCTGLCKNVLEKINCGDLLLTERILVQNFFSLFFLHFGNMSNEHKL